MQHLDFLDHILVGEKPIRFNQHQNRLYLDLDWGNDAQRQMTILSSNVIVNLTPLHIQMFLMISI